MNQSTDQPGFAPLRRGEPVNRVAMEIEADPACGIVLTDVASHLPRKKGKKVNYSTVWRWANQGYAGIILLETTLIGRCRFTSTHALRRFNRKRNALARARPMIAEELRLACGPKTNAAAKKYLAREGFPTGTGRKLATRHGQP